MLKGKLGSVHIIGYPSGICSIDEHCFLCLSAGVERAGTELLSFGIPQLTHFL